MSVQINDKVYWVGKVDDRKVPFHRLILESGTTYNSYLLMTDKPTVIDTVDIAFGREYVDNLIKLINPEAIEYIVINHVEPDHAGALPALAAKAKKAKIVTTDLGSQLLNDMFRLHHREFVIVRDGDSLDIGGRTLKFFETPYLHTEETMITYSEEDKTLFPCDIFSTHIAAGELFNDLAQGEYLEDFKVYYKLIMAPHRPYVRDMLDKISTLEIEMIAPSHGYILRENAASFIKLYDDMSKDSGNNKTKKVAVVYSTMTGNTAKVAQRLVKGLEDNGIATSVFNLKSADIKEVTEVIKESDGLLAGSSTKYADMVGCIEELLKELKGIPSAGGKFAAAFGSYGWSGEAIMHIENYLAEAGFKVVNQNYLVGTIGVDEQLFPLRVKFDREEGMETAEKAGSVFAELVNSN
ncbi:FprA family A-type flavoprotein [Ruminiclostridium cellobioparum]|uniref:Putative flavoprotein n=1 Tax=Ruminiclostridium cellobioparum subsp. termitidis CT1112 TaxID=1195236 RepID=S0FJT7_RUMCE|nr:putative flavoprotein [Ruminiclostridium cellobioparum subsp. termitidis CT1112]